MPYVKFNIVPAQNFNCQNHISNLIKLQILTFFVRFAEHMTVNTVTTSEKKR